MNVGPIPTPEFASGHQPARGPERADTSGRVSPNSSSTEHGPVESWIAEAESQVAMRQALMDCYNG